MTQLKEYLIPSSVIKSKYIQSKAPFAKMAEGALLFVYIHQWFSIFLEITTHLKKGDKKSARKAGDI